MSLGEANDFIERGMKDAGLRKRLNAARTSDELLTILTQERLTFTSSEFDDAFHHLLTECQFEEQADQLQEFKMWWNLTSISLQG